MKKRIIITILILLALTAVISTTYLCTRKTVNKGSLLVGTPSGEVTLSMSDLPLSDVEGETVNKKGETKKINAKGFAVADIPPLAGMSDYSEITLYSDDEYHADITRSELADHDKAWLIDDEGSFRLIVFGDSDSKRNVKNVVRAKIK